MKPDSAASAADYLARIQHADGFWEGEMLWCPVVTAQVIITRHIIGRPFDADDTRQAMLHFERAQNADGSFGLHPEHPGSVFVTTLSYVALRLLGIEPEHPVAVAARRWVHSQPGGVLSIPTWGKFWLSLVGLYGRDGLRPLPPELVLLPRWFPAHPMRLYCHTRYIYLAMAALQNTGTWFDLGRLGDKLISELYGPGGMPERFAKHRYHLAPADAFEPPNMLMRWGEGILGWFDRHSFRRLRRKSRQVCGDLIDRDLEATRFLTLSPVNGTLNALLLRARAVGGDAVERCLQGFEFYRWDDAQRGLRYAGGRTRVWDTGFAVESLLANPATAQAHRDVLQRAYRFLAEQQRLEPLAGRDPQFPDEAIGGWCLGDAVHGWPVSDCTAESLSAILGLHATPGLDLGKIISDDRLELAADFILSRQNRDGGFGSYERARGPNWLNRLNPSEMFARCMVDQSYVECTGSCLVALSKFQAAYPHRLAHRISVAMTRGVRFLERSQRRDGAFPGAWGIYLTYGTFHAVRGLRAAGLTASSSRLQRAAAWLIRRQKSDGGWGEHYTGCLRGEYVEHPQSQAPMTAWAVLALCDIVGPRHPAVQRGVDWLKSNQQPDGAWPRGAVNGVFFGTAMLDYDLYRIYFPTWALGRAAR